VIGGGEGTGVRVGSGLEEGCDGRAELRFEKHAEAREALAGGDVGVGVGVGVGVFG